MPPRPELNRQDRNRALRQKTGAAHVAAISLRGGGRVLAFTYWLASPAVSGGQACRRNPAAIWAPLAMLRAFADSGWPFMDTIVFLITLSAGALAVHYKERLRRFVPGRRQRNARVLVDQSLGLARLELPDGWRPAQDLNETASIEAINALHGRHVIVISDSVDDFVPEMTVYEHSANTRNELTGSIQLISCTGPERRTIGGIRRPAVRDRGLLPADAHQVSSHDNRRAPRLPPGIGLGDVFTVRPAIVRVPAQRLQRTRAESAPKSRTDRARRATPRRSCLALRSPLTRGSGLGAHDTNMKVGVLSVLSVADPVRLSVADPVRGSNKSRR